MTEHEALENGITLLVAGKRGMSSEVMQDEAERLPGVSVQLVKKLGCSIEGLETTLAWGTVGAL